MYSYYVTIGALVVYMHSHVHSFYILHDCRNDSNVYFHVIILYIGDTQNLMYMYLSRAVQCELAVTVVLKLLTQLSCHT